VEDGHEGREADRDRDEEEVVDGGDGELPSSKVQRVHGERLPGQATTAIYYRTS